MGGVAVVADSSACLPPELVSQLGIHVVPLRFFIEGQVVSRWNRHNSYGCLPHAASHSGTPYYIGSYAQ